MGVQIHPTAIVEEGAELGVDVAVGPYSLVGPHVKIGDRCRIRSHVVIEGHTTLGEDNDLFQFCSLGSAPQDLKFANEPSTLILGSRNKVREYVTLHPGTATGTMTTIIGDDNLFMANSHVAHDCRVGNSNVFANSAALAGHVQVGNRVILGGLVGIHQFCRLGDFVMLGGGAMVNNDMPPYCIGQGDRCEIRGLNLIGLQRAGFTPEELTDVKRAYRHLFSTIGHLKDKVASMSPELASRPKVKLLIDFVVSSERGVCQPRA